jgi:hypothetical protein
MLLILRRFTNSRSRRMESRREPAFEWTRAIFTGEPRYISPVRRVEPPLKPR